MPTETVVQCAFARHQKKGRAAAEFWGGAWGRTKLTTNGLGGAHVPWDGAVRNLAASTRAGKDNSMARKHFDSKP
jgi:hypothetical protein